MKIIKQCEQRNKRKGRLPIYVYLGYLLICTLLLTGVSFASYVSTSTASDSACVAKGMVTVSYSDDTEIEMSRPDDDGVETREFSFQVSNNASEVAIRYDVVVTLDIPLPDGVTMTLDEQPCSGSDNNVYIFPNMGTFQAGVNDIKTHTLSFTGDFTEMPSETDEIYTINISIHSQQID